jgi:uncharacterized protein HemY
VKRISDYPGQLHEPRSSIERDTKILKAELEDRPNDPFVLFNLGAIAVERRDWNEALGFLKRSLTGSAPSDSIVAQNRIIAGSDQSAHAVRPAPRDELVTQSPETVTQAASSPAFCVTDANCFLATISRDP